MYKLVVVTDKAIAPSLYRLKNLEDRTVSHEYITQVSYTSEDALKWLNMFMSNCSTNHNTVLSVQMLHESVITRKDV